MSYCLLINPSFILDLLFEKNQFTRFSSDTIQYKCIEIIIPNNIKAINPSYFLGFLGPSVRKCITEEDFNKKFKFKISSSDSQSFVESDINDGIQRALKESGLIEL